MIPRTARPEMAALWSDETRYRIWFGIEACAAGADLLMIGDTETDVKTAKAARVPCILTAFGYAPVPPETLGADAVISSFDALVETAEALLADSREAPGSLRP